MTHKKKCECGWIVVACSANAAGDAIKDHAAHKGCNAIHAKNI
jgi:hypothetical protein